MLTVPFLIFLAILVIVGAALAVAVIWAAMK